MECQDTWTSLGSKLWITSFTALSLLHLSKNKRNFWGENNSELDLYESSVTRWHNNFWMKKCLDSNSDYLGNYCYCLSISSSKSCCVLCSSLMQHSVLQQEFYCLILQGTFVFSDSWVWRERDRTVGWPIQVFRPLPLFTSWTQVSNQYNSIEVSLMWKGAAHRKGDKETTHCTLLSVFHAGYIELNAHFLNKWISWGGLIPWPP